MKPALRYVHAAHNALHPCYYGVATIYYLPGPLAWITGGLFVMTVIITVQSWRAHKDQQHEEHVL